MNPAHRWQIPLEEEAQGDTFGATLAEQHGLLGFGVNQFDGVAAAVVTPFTHNQIPSWLDGDRGGVMSLRPFGTIAVFYIVASDNAERLGRIKVVIRTVASCAPLPHRLSSLTGAVAAFQRRARAHGHMADDDVVAAHDRNLRLFSGGYLPPTKIPRYPVWGKYPPQFSRCQMMTGRGPFCINAGNQARARPGASLTLAPAGSTI